LFQATKETCTANKGFFVGARGNDGLSRYTVLSKVYWPFPEEQLTISEAIFKTRQKAD